MPLPRTRGPHSVWRVPRRLVFNMHDRARHVKRHLYPKRRSAARATWSPPSSGAALNPKGLFHVVYPDGGIPGYRRTGPLFYPHPGERPESRAKERQRRQDDEAFHGGQLLYPFGSMRRVSAWSDRVTDTCVQCAARDATSGAAAQSLPPREVPRPFRRPRPSRHAEYLLKKIPIPSKETEKAADEKFRGEHNCEYSVVLLPQYVAPV